MAKAGGPSAGSPRWRASQIGARLGRGRSYARRGQVLSIDIQPGEIKAKVQGSRPTPYAITIQLKPISAAGWKKLAQTLGRQTVYAAKLLAGEMPQDIEQVFKTAGLSLFPERLKDLVTDCSCPDWSNPCKHIAAVYYLIGEEFDRDPFLILKLRGMDREGLVALLDSAGTGTMTRRPQLPGTRSSAATPKKTTRRTRSGPQEATSATAAPIPEEAPPPDEFVGPSSAPAGQDHP